MGSISILDRAAVWSKRRILSQATLRWVSNQTTTTTSGTPNVFAATLQDSPFVRRRKPEQGRVTTPWIANLLKSFFVSQWQRQINSAVMYESCANQALHPNFYRGTTMSSPYQLENTFSNNLELTSMHVWICKTRIMCPTLHRSPEFDHAEARLFLQQLLERMWEHIARSLTGAGAHDIRLNKFLKEIQDSVFGSFIAYDQAFARVIPVPDCAIQSYFHDRETAIESFSAATMSNFFGPTEAVRDASNVRAARALADYMIGQLQHLEQCSDDELKSIAYSIVWEDLVPALNNMMMEETRDETRTAGRDQPVI